jgi:3-phenylpropionate/cinnamic acid dioxygenase small subunit
VARLGTGMAWAEDPPSCIRHLIGNLGAAPLENGEVEAKTSFLVFRSHLERDHQLLSGCRENVLRKVNGAWKVARPTIVLDANVLLEENLSVFLQGSKPIVAGASSGGAVQTAMRRRVPS